MAIEIPDVLLNDVFSDPDVDYRCAYGGRGGGKSYSFALMAALRAMDWARGGGEGSIVCARQVQDSLRTSSFKEVARAIRDTPEFKDFFEIGKEFIRTKDMRVDFQFVGLEHNVQSVKSTSRIIVLWVDEAEPVTNEAWSIADATIRENGSEMWVTWNPESEASPTNQRFRVHAPPRTAIACVNWRDNKWFSEKSNRNRIYDLENYPDDYAWKWEGEFRKVTEGAYYAKDLIRCMSEGRIGLVAKDPLTRVMAFWDIGGTGRNSDARSIWIAQFKGSEIRVLDYHESVGQELGEDVMWLRENGYDHCHCVLPHDGAQHDRVYNVTYQSMLRDAGFTAEVVPNAGKGAKMLRIQAAHRAFPNVRFDEKKTEPGRKALEFYHAKIDRNRHIDLGPAHDWSSHASDAWGLLCLYYESRDKTELDMSLLNEYEVDY